MLAWVGGDVTAYISSRGEMKMSLRLMIWRVLEFSLGTGCCIAHILVSKMLQKLQLAVCPLRQDRSAEGLHDLLDGHRLASELVLG